MAVRSCAKCHEQDEAPHHFVSGFRVERQMATLDNGNVVPVDTPVDESYHLDCHAEMGCEHCQDMLALNSEPRAVGKSLEVPEHLVTIEPGEFAIDENGVHVRVLSKDEAIAQREGEAKQAGVEVLPAAEADQLHANHQG